MENYFLYAEDDQDDADILTDVLQSRHQNKIVHVENGFEIISHLQNVKKGEGYPCLIILDLKLPKLNGMETLELLKTDDFFRLIPVLILSARVSEDQMKVCKSFGADVMIKPQSYTHWKQVVDYMSAYIDE